MDEKKKHIDESWKETVAKEKGSSQKEQESVPQEASFSFFVSTLALQTSIFLGQIPNPATNKKEKNLPQAKFIIDTLGMLQEKTKNNLNQEENNLLENVLYELRMQYVARNKEGGE
ncbi:MAG: DUF1844 domain-containing protein [Candidatus Omnitrophota bacterium]|jgi:hypothetical protein